jgi:hypothetical protein
MLFGLADFSIEEAMEIFKTSDNLLIFPAEVKRFFLHIFG